MEPVFAAACPFFLDPIDRSDFMRAASAIRSVSAKQQQGPTRLASGLCAAHDGETQLGGWAPRAAVGQLAIPHPR